jgi:hypothetical protein
VNEDPVGLGANRESDELIDEFKGSLGGGGGDGVDIIRGTDRGATDGDTVRGMEDVQELSDALGDGWVGAESVAFGRFQKKPTRLAVFFKNAEPGSNIIGRANQVDIICAGDDVDVGARSCNGLQSSLEGEADIEHCDRVALSDS